MSRASNKRQSTRLHPHQRESAIETIKDYVRLGDDNSFGEILGISPSRGDLTDAQWCAAVSAVLPLLDDERLTVLMFHIAELAVLDREAA